METNEEEKEEDPAPVVNDKTEKPEEKEEKEAVKNEQKEMTFEDLLAKAPQGVRAQINRGQKKYDDEKAFLIEGLIKNERNTFTKEVLESKDIDELEGLCALAKVPLYLGNFAPDNRLNLKKDDNKETAPKSPSYIGIVQNAGKMEDGTQLNMK
jgi:hypothetical protein